MTSVWLHFEVSEEQYQQFLDLSKKLKLKYENSNDVQQRILTEAFSEKMNALLASHGSDPIMMEKNIIDQLDHIIFGWPKASRREIGSQIIFSIDDVDFCWLSYETRRVRIRPYLGSKSLTASRGSTRQLERDGEEIRIINRKTGVTDVMYYDPSHLLVWEYGYPGFKCSKDINVEKALALVVQAWPGFRLKLWGEDPSRLLIPEILAGWAASSSLEDLQSNITARLRQRYGDYLVTENFAVSELGVPNTLAYDVIKGRYVRLYSNGNTSNDLNHYLEVEVFGTPAK